MNKATWLWVGLALAVASPASGQPAGGAPPKAPAPARKAPAKGKKVTELPTADLAALAGTDVEAAARAATNLGALDLPAAHEALLDALALGLAPSVAGPAIVALAMHPAPPDVLSLKRYANHHTPAVRIVALTALASYPSPDAQATITAGLHDTVGMVRTAAAQAAAKGHVRSAIEPMMQLLARGEDSSARALAAVADADLARKLAEQLGKVPDPTLALCLGAILKRADFTPDAAKVEIVRTIAKIQDPSAVTVLSDYVAATPKTPPRTSRQEAQLVIDARVGGK